MKVWVHLNILILHDIIVHYSKIWMRFGMHMFDMSQVGGRNTFFTKS